MCTLKSCIFFLLALIFISALNAQNPYKPSVIPPSPNAASLAKYGDLPVSLYTGTTDITVPIYTASIKGLQIPITLSYHTGGIKLNEEASWVGLGWALNAGGNISRTIMDKDDYTGSFFAANTPEIKTDLELPAPLAGQAYMGKYAYDFLCNYKVTTVSGTTDLNNAFNSTTSDKEPDVYNFNFLGHSGKFIIGRDGNILMQQQENLRIQFDISNGNYFIITDEQGDKFFFLDVEMTQTVSGTDPHKSSWYLTKIITQQQDTVKFNYAVDNTWTNVVGNVNEVSKVGCSGTQGFTRTNDVGQSYFNRVLQSIDYSTGQIQFSSDGTRTDLENGKKLNSIKIYSKDANGKLSYLKESKLFYSYFYPNSGVSPSQLEFQRLRLDSVKQVSGAVEEKPYVFAYFMSATGQQNMGKHSYSVDHWGYFNNASNSQFIPTFVSEITPQSSSQLINLPGANRDPDSVFTKIFSLTQVQYPTGGYTTIEYEGNLYDRQNSVNGEGRDFEYETLVDTTVDISLTGRGNFSGSINLQNVYPQITQNSGSNASLSIAFRANSSDSLNYYHNSLGYGKINFTFQNNVSDISNASLNCSGGTLNNGNCNGLVYATYVPLTIQPTGTYAWSAYIDPQVSTGGFPELKATFSWKEVQYLHKTRMTAGGLRIKVITDYTAANSIAKRKRYDYDYMQDKNGSGTPQVYSYGKMMSFVSYAHKEADLSSSTYCNGITLYANSDVSLNGISKGNIVGYDQVTEYVINPTNGVDNGKTVYSYINIPDSVFTYLGWRLPGVQNMGNGLTGLQIAKADYSKSGETYKKVSEINNFYHTENRKIYWSPKYRYIQSTSGASLSCPGGVTVPYEYMVCFSPFKSEIVLQDSSIQYLYDANNNVVSTKTYLYYDNPVHYQLTRSQSIDSKGNTHTAFTRYPQDYLSGSGTGNIVLDSMIAKNYISVPIEKRDSLYLSGAATGSVTSAKASVFKLFSGSVMLDKQYKLQTAMPITNFQPLAISSGNFVMDARYRQMASIDGYDNNYNIQQYTTTDGILTSIIWDYLGMYPVAEIINASSDQIAYTSFESSGTGGWSGLSLPGFANNGSLTGKRAYTQNNFNIYKNGLNASGSFLVTYWSKNGPYSVNGTSSTTLRTSNGWTLFQHRITNPTNGTITVTGSGSIDELRLYPSTAQMKTYAYESGIGTSSVCDINNRIIYYYYDRLGRLLLVKDDNGNIVKKFCYNYQGQSSTCAYYSNVALSGSYTKNNCTSGTGQSTTYAVPAGIYYATTETDANALAQSEMDALGVTYANLTVGCNLPTYSVTGSNSKAIGYTVTFKQPGTSTILYSFSLSSGLSNFNFSQQVSQGTYDVQFQPGGTPVTANFAVNALTMTGVNAALFNNVTISGNSTISAY